MKKITAFILSAALMLSITACKGNETDNPVETSTATEVVTSPVETETSENVYAPKDDENISGQIFNQFRYGMTKEEVVAVGTGNYKGEVKSLFGGKRTAVSYSNYDFCGEECNIQLEFDEEQGLDCIALSGIGYELAQEKAMLCAYRRGDFENMDFSYGDDIPSFDAVWENVKDNGIVTDVKIFYGYTEKKNYTMMMFALSGDEGKVLSDDGDDFSGQVFNQFKFGMTVEQVKSVGVLRLKTEKIVDDNGGYKSYYFEDYDFCGERTTICFDFGESGLLESLSLIVYDGGEFYEKQLERCKKKIGDEDDTFFNSLESDDSLWYMWYGVNENGNNVNIGIRRANDDKGDFSQVFFICKDEIKKIDERSETAVTTEKPKETTVASVQKNIAASDWLFTNLKFGMSYEEAKKSVPGTFLPDESDADALIFKDCMFNGYKTNATLFFKKGKLDTILIESPNNSGTAMCEGLYLMFCERLGECDMVVDDTPVSTGSTVPTISNWFFATENNVSYSLMLMYSKDYDFTSVMFSSAISDEV